MRSISHKFLVFLIFAAIMFVYTPNKAFAFTNKENTQKIFSLGNSVGASYYHLVNLCDKARFEPYSALKNAYSDAFQSLNIMDVILDDLEISKNSHALLDKLRFNLYNSLNDEDLNEIALLNIRDAYILYYENLAKDIQNKFLAEGSWLFALGYYSSFQLESLNSPCESKLLLSGFNKILNSNPLSNLPETLLSSLKTVNNLDKTYINDKELECLKQNIIKITEFFGNYRTTPSLVNKINELRGIWQGILIDPQNQRHKIKLIVNEDINIKMNIDGIAENISISDVKLINNYFTFMFKPFGGEKLYIKFNAKIYNNTFSGEIIDALGQKGNWLLSKVDSKN